MSRFFNSLVAAALLLGTVAAQPYPSNNAPTPQPSANPALLHQAKIWFTALQNGKIDRSALANNSANNNLNDATIANAQKMLGSLGPPVSFVQQQSSTQNNMTAAIYAVTFKNGKTVDFLFAVDSQGKVESLGLGTPH